MHIISIPPEQGNSNNVSTIKITVGIIGQPRDIGIPSNLNKLFMLFLINFHIYSAQLTWTLAYICECLKTKVHRFLEK